jgi:hypothetical protein
VGLHDLNSADVYDTTTGRFSSTGAMIAGRANHTATLLSDGEVLIAGGSQGLSSAELYDPKAGRFALVTNTMGFGRSGHIAVLLGDGNVLLAGGTGNSGASSSAELFRR